MYLVQQSQEGVHSSEVLNNIGYLNGGGATFYSRGSVLSIERPTDRHTHMHTDTVP